MTKGYKATYNFKCLNQIYEIGQEYKLDHKPEMCVSGFHYCLNAIQTIRYYPINKEFKLLEIEDLSSNTVTDDNKSCSNHIKIIREITDSVEQINLTGRAWRYIEETRTFAMQDVHSYWIRCYYDENGNCISYADSDKAWGTWSYDDLGCVRLSKFSDNYYASIFKADILTNY